MRGLHSLIMAHISKGVKVLLCGTAGEVRAAAEQIATGVDAPVTKFKMDAFFPSEEHRPYRFGRREYMIMGLRQPSYQVRAP